MAHNVARACSMGRLISCSCDPSSYKGKIPASARGVQWKWGGCSHNLDYGIEFSKQFLDPREEVGDIQSTVILHNNQAGRLVRTIFATFVTNVMFAYSILVIRFLDVNHIYAYKYCTLLSIKKTCTHFILQA